MAIARRLCIGGLRGNIHRIHEGCVEAQLVLKHARLQEQEITSISWGFGLMKIQVRWFAVREGGTDGVSDTAENSMCLSSSGCCAQRCTGPRWFMANGFGVLVTLLYNVLHMWKRSDLNVALYETQCRAMPAPPVANVSHVATPWSRYPDIETKASCQTSIWSIRLRVLAGLCSCTISRPRLGEAAAGELG